MDTSTTPRTAAVAHAAEHRAITDDLPGAALGSSPTPERLMQLGFGFWGAKTLLSAVELGLFSELATGPLDAETLRASCLCAWRIDCWLGMRTPAAAARLGLHPRGARDFFDALVALGMLERNNGRYHNAPETDLFLDAGKALLSWRVVRDAERTAVRLLGIADRGAPHG